MYNNLRVSIRVLSNREPFRYVYYSTIINATGCRHCIGPHYVMYLRYYNILLYYSRGAFAINATLYFYNINYNIYAYSPTRAPAPRLFYATHPRPNLVIILIIIILQ